VRESGSESARVSPKEFVSEEQWQIMRWTEGQRDLSLGAAIT